MAVVKALWPSLSALGSLRSVHEGVPPGSRPQSDFGVDPTLALSPATQMIRFERLTKRYGSLVAVADLSLEVQGGEVYAQIGRAHV